MPSPSGNYTPTTIRAIAAAIKGRLIEYAALDADQIIITTLAPEKVPTLASAFDVIFQLRGESPDVKMIDGAARRVNLRCRDVSLSIRSRLQLDTIGSEETHLLDAGEGHTAYEDAVCDALETWQPTDSAGNALVVEVLRLGRLSEARQLPKAEEWLISTWEMNSLKYVRNLTQDF